MNKTKRRGRGRAPIIKTVDKYFQSIQWKEFWDKVRADNPIVFIIVKNRMGTIERVLLKKSIPGEEFKVTESVIHGSVIKKIIPKLIEPPDEEILKEIGALQVNNPPTDLLGDSQSPSLPTKVELSVEDQPREKVPDEVDVQVGDKIVVRNDGMTGIVEVLELYEEEGKFKVKFPSSGKEVIKDASDFVRIHSKTDKT